MFSSEKCNLTDFNAAKAALSFAALKSVVVHALGSCQPGDIQADGMGVDARCSFVWKDGQWRRTDFAAQLKSSSQDLKTMIYNGEECWAHRVDPKQLEKYRAQSNSKLVLFLVLFPADEDYEEWVKILDDSTVLKNRIYWVLIEDAGEAASVVYVPTRNRLTQESLLREIVYPLEAKHEH